MAVLAVRRPSNHIRDLMLGGVILALVAMNAPAALRVLAQESPDGDGRAVLDNAFTFQGRLIDGGLPVEGPHDFQFKLWTDPAAGLQAGSTITANDLVVSNGLFSVRLDFGVGFNNQVRWLETIVDGQTQGRTELTATPYALFASNAGTAATANTAASVPWTGITGVPEGFADGIDDTVDVDFTDARYWLQTGNDDIAPGDFLGTTTNTALEFRVNGVTGLRIFPGLVPNVIGGDVSNSIAPNVFGATIAGGGLSVPAGSNNHVADQFGTIGGGSGNVAGFQATVAGGDHNRAPSAQSAIGGGFDNEASAPSAYVGGGIHNLASGQDSVVSGGDSNTASGVESAVLGGVFNRATGENATVGGGENNTASGLFSTVGGGSLNEATKPSSTVGGGASNEATGNGATVAGGNNNTAPGQTSFVGGGAGNQANGTSSTVPGGHLNVAGGSTSFAAGNRAKALGNGSFVWADGKAQDYMTTLPNHFIARAQGGFVFTVRTNDTTGAETEFCQLFQGSGGWDCTSDRNMKTGFKDVDGSDILARLRDVPIQYWSIKDLDNAPTHIGPMAQDFYAAFGMGNSDTVIATIDLDGVALAGVKALDERTLEQQRQIEALQRQLGTSGSEAGLVPSAARPASLASRMVVGGSLALFGGSMLCMALWSHRRRTSYSYSNSYSHHDGSPG